MADDNTIPTTKSIDINAAGMAMNRAFGIIDSLYTLEVTGDIESLRKGTLSALLDAAMTSITEAREAISHA